jgi:hypothetical protein
MALRTRSTLSTEGVANPSRMAKENLITGAIPPTVPVQNITDLDANLVAT